MGSCLRRAGCRPPPGLPGAGVPEEAAGQLAAWAPGPGVRVVRRREGLRARCGLGRMAPMGPPEARDGCHEGGPAKAAGGGTCAWPGCG
eukprot:7882517-Lingulodinium_polyedra.AAC.1